MTDLETDRRTWMTDPFERFIDHSERLRQLLHLSRTGISVLRGMPTIVQVLQDLKPGVKTGVGKLERAKREAELAQREVLEGFPLLKAQALISLWSALEGALRTFIVRSLQNDKKIFSSEPLQKIRVKISEYERLEGEEKWFYILERLEQETTAPLKNGVGRFEVLLEVCGLGGAVHDTDRKALFELNHIRNVLVHRSGIADRRIVEACPSLSLKVGQPLVLTDAMVSRYFEASMQYVTDIIVRLGERDGADMSKFKQRPRNEG